MYRRGKLQGGAADAYAIMDDVANISGAFSGPLTSFNTTFSGTENPISQGGLFTNGGTNGLDWQDVETTGGAPGIAFGVGSSPSSFNDCICTLQGLFTPAKHYSEVTFVVTPGYTPPSSHEVEILVGFTIGAHSAAGYEMDIGWTAPVNIVRWNGAQGDFTTAVFTVLSGSAFTVADGDVVRVIFDSSSGSPVITLLLNGVVGYVVTDTTAGKIVSGNPGMGFFARPGAGLDMTKYCAKGFAAGSA